jgi:putative DNA primase/helicase
MSSQPLRDRAQGRWAALLTTFGIDRRYLTGKHGPCPICRDGRDRFRFDDKDGRGTWICSVCGAGDGFALLMQVKGWDFKEAAAEIEPKVDNAPKHMATRRERDEKSLRESMNWLWQSGKPVEYGDPVYRYLDARGLAMDSYPASLRRVEKCRYAADPPSYHPAMLAKVTAPDGKPVTLHRTYLDDDGNKANVESPRRLMPGKLVKGCAIRLGEPGDSLGIAEGIETALAVQLMCSVPCWAAVSANMLMAWEPPADIKEIIVFGDNDRKYAGQASAFALAHRLAMRGRQVRVEMPPEKGMDWNDVLLSESEAA